MNKSEYYVLYFAYLLYAFFLFGIALSVFYTSGFGIIGNVLGALFTRIFIVEYKNFMNL